MISGPWTAGKQVITFSSKRTSSNVQHALFVISFSESVLIVAAAICNGAKGGADHLHIG